MNKDYKKILKNLTTLEKSIMTIHQVLSEILNHPEKNISVGIGDKSFNLIQPFTVSEHAQKKDTIWEIANLIMHSELQNYIQKRFKEEDSSSIDILFSTLLAFTRGKDPKTMQLKGKTIIAIKKLQAEKLLGKKSISLDMESYHVKNELSSETISTL